jgi:hypothetical protein
MRVEPTRRSFMAQPGRWLPPEPCCRTGQSRIAFDRHCGFAAHGRQGPRREIAMLVVKRARVLLPVPILRRCHARQQEGDNRQNSHSAEINGCKFAVDSLLEEGGFELSVPPEQKAFRGR